MAEVIGEKSLTDVKAQGHSALSILKQKRKIQEDYATKNVSDILYQMIIDEKKFGLDKKTTDILQIGKDKEFMMQTRSDLLRKVADDLERARQLTQQPDFKFKEMSELLAGKDVKKDEKKFEEETEQFNHIEDPYESAGKLHEAIAGKYFSAHRDKSRISQKRSVEAGRSAE